MKELYVVSSHVQYEGNDSIGVFVGLSQALEAIRDYVADYDGDEVFMIQKYEIGVIYDVPFLVGYFDKKGTQIYPYGVR
jgi:hypothetical protein